MSPRKIAPTRSARRAQATARARQPLLTVEVCIAGAAQTLQLDLAESPLGWLATRKGRDGAALVSPVQVLAGERLRLDFTRAGLTPRVTTDWSMSGRTGGGGGQGAEGLTYLVIGARRRVQAALAALGPELSGTLLDVCCFLKGLEQVEQERGWPPRTAKVVLGLGLDRLARHYRLSAQATGAARSPVRAWHAPAAVEGE